MPAAGDAVAVLDRMAAFVKNVMQRFARARSVRIHRPRQLELIAWARGAWSLGEPGVGKKQRHGRQARVRTCGRVATREDVPCRVELRRRRSG